MPKKQKLAELQQIEAPPVNGEISVIQPDRLTPDEIIKVKHFGAFQYDSTRCFVLLGWIYSPTGMQRFERMWNDPSHEFWVHYNAGRYEYEFTRDVQQLTLSHDGDISAAREIEKNIVIRKNATQ